MGDLWALPRRLCRRAEPEHPFNNPTADFRLPLRRIVGSGRETTGRCIIRMIELIPSVYFMVASGR